MYERIWNAAKMEQSGRWWKNCFGAIYDFIKRIVADSARWLHGGLKILPHGPPKTWGEPCGARVKRRRGVMTTAPAETCYVPIVRVAWQMWRELSHIKIGSDYFLSWSFFYSKSDTMRWQFRLPAHSCDFESTMITLTDWRKYALWKNLLHEKKQQKF